jgi:hypothetical protein
MCFDAISGVAQLMNLVAQSLLVDSESNELVPGVYQTLFPMSNFEHSASFSLRANYRTP